MSFANYMMNFGILVGFYALAMVLLRPVLLRLFTAQQRVVLWWACVGVLYIASAPRIVGQTHLFFPNLQLPVHLAQLVTNQTWQESVDVWPGPYYVDLDQWIKPLYLNIFYGGGVLLIVLWLTYQTVQANKLRYLGVEIPKDDPCFQRTECDCVNEIYVVEGIQTSFVDGFNNIFLQKISSPQRMYQILLHEAEHVQLRHVYIKFVFSTLLLMHWWNPLLWLGFRYLLRDMELACDSAVLEKLNPAERIEYTKTLVELGCGRQLWTQPLCFGECDAEIRVKAALKWKPQGMWLRWGRFAMMAVVIWFFCG